MAAEQHFVVQLKRSGAGRKPDQRATLEGIGLRRFGKSVFLKDTPAVRGMLYKVVHLVSVETRDGPPAVEARPSAFGIIGWGILNC
ncbi:MAG: 50S ribosomal protein L30 [Myxococcota bacterium]